MTDHLILLLELLRQLGLTLLVLVQLFDHKLDETAHIVGFFGNLLLLMLFFFFFLGNNVFIYFLNLILLRGWEVESGLGASLLLQFFQLAVYSRQPIHDSLLALIVTTAGTHSCLLAPRLLAGRAERPLGEPILHVQNAQKLG